MKQTKITIFMTVSAFSALLCLTAASFAQEIVQSSGTEVTTVATVRSDAPSVIPVDKIAAPSKDADTSVDPAPSAAADKDKWHFEIRPYLWAAGLNGTLRARNQTVQVKQDFSNIFGMLDFALATQFEAGKGRWRIMIDENYINMGTDVRGPNGNVSFAVEPTLNIFEGGASFLMGAVPHKDDSDGSRPPAFSAELLGGVRHISMRMQIRPNEGTTEIDGRKNLVGGFIGNRYKFNVSRAMTLIGKWTIGTSGVKSNTAATAAGLIDVRFSKKYSLMGGYQFMDIKADSIANPAGFNGQMKGLIMGFTSYF